MERHRLYVWPLLGGLIGLIVSLVIGGITPMAVPMTIAEKPILAMPPLAVICYTGASVGRDPVHGGGSGIMAIRPNVRNPMSDDRISQGLIGLLVNAGADQSPRVTAILNEAGAVDVTAR